jgi:hypothetical protein
MPPTVHAGMLVKLIEAELVIDPPDAEFHVIVARA